MSWWDKTFDLLSRHWKLMWVVVLIFPIKWFYEHEPPFEIVKYIEPDAARRGETITFAMPVKRDLERQCSAHFTRHLIDAGGVRHDYGLVQFMSSGSIEGMERVMGPWLKVAITLPKGALPGRAVLVTELEYNCNLSNAFWPIKLSLYFPFTILE